MPTDIEHRHWGDHGAAGVLLIVPKHRRVLLQRRSAYVDAPGTWSIPGGAIEPPEDAEDAAVRELLEELQVSPSMLRLLGSHSWTCPEPACGGWSYTTILARVQTGDAWSDDAPNQWETAGIRWTALADVAGMADLHPGFAAAWPELRRLVERLLG